MVKKVLESGHKCWTNQNTSCLCNGDAKFLYKWNEDHSFLKRNVNINDVGNSAFFFFFFAGGVTGEIHYVDAGYNKVGMPDPKICHDY